MKVTVKKQSVMMPINDLRPGNWFIYREKVYFATVRTKTHLTVYRLDDNVFLRFSYPDPEEVEVLDPKTLELIVKG